MSKFALVHKKRRIIFWFGIASIVIAPSFLLIYSFTDLEKILPSPFKEIILFFLGLLFLFGLFITNYADAIKITVGYIEFFSDLVVINYYGNQNKIYLSDLVSVNFILAGYQGQNTNPIGFLGLSGLKTQSGLKNLVQFEFSNGSKKTVEVYIDRKSSWNQFKKISSVYNDLINNK